MKVWQIPSILLVIVQILGCSAGDTIDEGLRVNRDEIIGIAYKADQYLSNGELIIAYTGGVERYPNFPASNKVETLASQLFNATQGCLFCSRLFFSGEELLTNSGLKLDKEELVDWDEFGSVGFSSSGSNSVYVAYDGESSFTLIDKDFKNYKWDKHEVFNENSWLASGLTLKTQSPESGYVVFSNSNSHESTLMRYEAGWSQVINFPANTLSFHPWENALFFFEESMYILGSNEVYSLAEDDFNLIWQHDLNINYIFEYNGQLIAHNGKSLIKLDLYTNKGEVIIDNTEFSKVNDYTLYQDSVLLATDNKVWKLDISNSLVPLLMDQ